MRTFPTPAGVVTVFEDAASACAAAADQIARLIAEAVAARGKAVLGLATGGSPILVYRRLVRPRLAPPADLEDPRPPRFAQTVGLAVTGVGLLLALAGVPWAVEISGGLALIAAVLNAAFGLCLGCELYLLLARLRAA